MQADQQQSRLIDARGPRFAAWITTVVLIAVLVVAFVAPLAAGLLLLAQAVAFAIGVLAGPGVTPYGLLYRTLRAPRNGPPTELEPVAPVRFAQAVGLAFALVGTTGLISGQVVVGVVATALALVAAFLNAAFGLCLGCELYLGYRRATRRPLTARVRPTQTEEAVAG